MAHKKAGGSSRNGRDSAGHSSTVSSHQPAATTIAAPAATEGEAGSDKGADPTVFASYNIYSKNLDTGEVLQYTDVVGGCTVPQVFIGEKGVEKLVFSSYYRARNSLYITDTDPIGGVSDGIYFRKLAAETGLSLRQYIIQARIKKARESLPVQKDSLGAGLDCGFYDQSHFIRHFKRHVGITPGTYIDSVKMI